MKRLYFSLFIVFLLCGIWHGAAWTFVVFGILHGLYLIFGVMTANFRVKFTKKLGLRKFPRLHALIQIGITFSLWCFAAIFFRANSLSDAFYIIANLFRGLSLDLSIVHIGGLGLTGFFIALVSILFLEIIQALQDHVKMRRFLSDRPVLLRWAVYLTLIFSILLFGMFETKQFIYFQF